MKLTLKDIKARLAEKPKVVRPSVPQFFPFVCSKLDLDPFQVADEVWVIPDYINQELESKVLDYGVYSNPLLPLRGRNVQMYGGTVTPEGLSDRTPLPQWLDIFSQRLFDEHIFPFKPNHVLINEYKPGDGILPHTDGPAYYPIVCTLSLGSDSVLQFWQERAPKFAVYLPQRSLVVFGGSLYYEHLHSIEMLTYDLILVDPSGNFTVTESGLVSPLLGKLPKLPPSQLDFGFNCPNTGRPLNFGFLNYRDTRISLTIRYVPLIG